MNVDVTLNTYPQKVRDDIGLITNTIIDVLPKAYGLRSIILYGGFAKGESALSAIENRNTPFGDYDILVISDKKVPTEIIKSIYDEIFYTSGYQGVTEDTSGTLDELNNAANVIDLHFNQIDDIRYAVPDIANYDLMCIGKILFGENVLDVMDIKLHDIPYSSPFRILNNRLSLLLDLMYPYYFLKEPNNVEKMALKFAAVRVYLAIEIGISFDIGKYTPEYSEQLKVIHNNWDKIKDYYPPVLSKIEEANEFKRKPSINNLENPIKDWFSAAKDGCEIAKILAGRMVPEISPDMSWEDYANVIYRVMPKKYYSEYLKYNFKRCYGIDMNHCAFLSIIPNAYYNLLFRKQIDTISSIHKSITSPQLILFSALPFILNSLDENGEITDKQYIEQAQFYLNKLTPIHLNLHDQPIQRWEELRKTYVYLWKEYGKMPKGVNLKNALEKILKGP